MLEEQSTLRNPTPEGATATGAPTTSDPALVRHARAGLLIAIAAAIGIGSVVVGSRYLGAKGSASHGGGEPIVGASSSVATQAEATAASPPPSIAAEPPGETASAESPTVEPVPTASASATARPRPGASKPAALPKPTAVPTATPAPVTTSDDPLDNYRPK
jgi:hypothetical protein